MSNPVRPLRILIVEDDRDALWTLVMLLSAAGHDVRTATDGRQALDMVRLFEPDVLVLDIGLPEMNGYEVARKIHTRYSERRPLLIGITGQYRHGGDQIVAEAHGFDHYLLKPYDPERLLALLRDREAISQATAARS